MNATQTHAANKIENPSWPDAYCPSAERDEALRMLERIELQLSGRTDKVIVKLMEEARATIKKLKP